MNGLISAQLSKLVGSIDLFHLLKVLTGTDQPTEREITDLKFVHHMLSVPTASDFVWNYVSDFLSKKGWSDIFLAQLQAGMTAHQVEGDPPLAVEQARQPFVDILSAIIHNPQAVRLHALVQCPNCDFLHGATS